MGMGHVSIPLTTICAFVRWGIMQYPATLVDQIGGVNAFAAALSAHPLAPKRRSNNQLRRVEPATVYVWKSRDFIPFMWQPVVLAIAGARRREAAA
jgi:hypothetical protein